MAGNLNKKTKILYLITGPNVGSRDDVEKVLYLLNNPDKAKRLGNHGRKLIEKKYNWENESKELLKIYEKLLTN